MKTLVTYDSYFINTQKVAEAVAEGLEHAGFQVMFERIYQVDFNAISDIDLLVVGSPTHNQGMPRPVKSVLKKLPKGILDGKQVIAFDTRYKMLARKSGSAAKQILKLLERLGGNPAALPESFFVQERRGPLYPGELERAQAWAAGILKETRLPVQEPI
jgi:flavodoxin